MKRLTQEQIEEINNKISDSWNQGIFKEPSNIDIKEKGLVIYQRYETGGMSGGSCWDDEDDYARPFTIDEIPEWEALDLALKIIYPEISYLQYKDIIKLVKDTDNTEYEYYGNCTDYYIQWIVLEDLYKYLEI